MDYQSLTRTGTGTGTGFRLKASATACTLSRKSSRVRTIRSRMLFATVFPFEIDTPNRWIWCLLVTVTDRGVYFDCTPDCHEFYVNTTPLCPGYSHTRCSMIGICRDRCPAAAQSGSVSCARKDTDVGRGYRTSELGNQRLQARMVKGVTLRHEHCYCCNPAGRPRS